MPDVRATCYVKDILITHNTQGKSQSHPTFFKIKHAENPIVRFVNDVHATLGSPETVQTKPGSKQMFIDEAIVQHQISSKYGSILNYILTSITKEHYFKLGREG